MTTRPTAPRPDVDEDAGRATRDHGGSDCSEPPLDTDLGHASDVEPDQVG